MNGLIDTHAHIYLDVFKEDRDVIISSAKKNNVTGIYMPNIDTGTIDAMLEVEEQYKGFCKSMMGLHPCSVKSDFQKELYVMENWLSQRDFTAIGEIGTDLYWDKTYWEQQMEAFLIQINWGKKHKKPVIIHCRESIDQTIDLVERENDHSLTGIFHCFTGTLEQARRIIDLGFFLGLGGVATFKNGGLDKVLPEIDKKHIVLETDSPYLAPVPFRGKRNEPSYLNNIAEKVSQLMNVEREELMGATSANARKVFQE